MFAQAQALGNALFAQPPYTFVSNTAFVTDLYWAYLQRAPDSGGLNWWVSLLNNDQATPEQVRAAFATSGEFEAKAAAICPSTASGGLKYVLSDHQGSARLVTNNTGTIVSRHDYAPFGEELWAGVGMRTTAQGYGATDTVRQRYGLTERNEATGLEHTWWRTYDNTAGRWTSPDPYKGSIDQDDPQSFNRYAYVGNDPLNSVDPVGLVGIPAAAIATAKAALNNPPCRHLFGRTDPVALLDKLLKSNRIKVTNTSFTETITKNARTGAIISRRLVPIAWRTNEWANTTPDGTIFINGTAKSPFFTGIVYNGNTPIQASNALGIGKLNLTPSQQQAVTLIHELLHASPTRGGDFTNDDRNPDVISRNSELIRIVCFVIPQLQNRDELIEPEPVSPGGTLNLREPISPPRSNVSNWNPFDLLFLLLNDSRGRHAQANKRR